MFSSKKKRHTKDHNPLLHGTGAFATLRNGSELVIPPRDADEYNLQLEIAWLRTSDERDIVSYREIQIEGADKVAILAQEYINAIAESEDDPISAHPLSKLALEEKRRDLEIALKEYSRNWPNFPEFDGIERLAPWKEDFFDSQE